MLTNAHFFNLLKLLLLFTKHRPVPCLKCDFRKKNPLISTIVNKHRKKVDVYDFLCMTVSTYNDAPNMSTPHNFRSIPLLVYSNIMVLVPRNIKWQGACSPPPSPPLSQHACGSGFSFTHTDLNLEKTNQEQKTSLVNMCCIKFDSYAF